MSVGWNQRARHIWTRSRRRSRRRGRTRRRIRTRIFASFGFRGHDKPGDEARATTTKVFKPGEVLGSLDRGGG